MFTNLKSGVEIKKYDIQRVEPTTEVGWNTGGQRIYDEKKA
jgi:hypothetical protein